MFRKAALALALIATTTAPAAMAAEDISKDKPQITTPSDFGCALRMMYMGNKARDALKKPETPADKRPAAERLNNDSRRAFFYYVGRMGPEFSAKNRSDEGKKLFSEMLDAPRDILAQEIALCLTNAEKAERDALNAMKSPTAK